MLFFILICAAFPLYYFGYTAYDLYGYSAGIHRACPACG
jgi:hypothetical protein